MLKVREGTSTSQTGLEAKQVHPAGACVGEGAGSGVREDKGE